MHGSDLVWWTQIPLPSTANRLKNQQKLATRKHVVKKNEIATRKARI